MGLKEKIQRVSFLGFFLLVFFLGTVFFVIPSLATDYSSSSFIVRDPVITVAGSLATSSSFTYFSSIGQTAIGESVGTSFSWYAGFLYFADISIPTLTATAGNSQVSLSWTESTSTFGYVVTSYEVGQATASGGPYTYTDVGNVLSSTASSLTNGTPYYFIIRVIDNQGDVVATSTESSATPVYSAVCGDSVCNGSETCSSCPADCGKCGGGGGGGGGGGVVVTPQSSTVNLFGRAYPMSEVTVLKDGQIIITTIAGPDARFSTTIPDLSSGSHTFSVYSEDKDKNRSPLFTFPVYLTQGATTAISGIFLAPTISIDKEQVKKGDTLTIFGQSVPDSEITIAVNSDQEHFEFVDADKDGTYFFDFDTAPLELGDHSTKSKSKYGGQISSYSRAVGFIVGDKTISKEEGICGEKADLNCDGKVNLVDFSIAAYWYKRPLSDSFKAKEAQNLSGDGKVDLVDFSIMAFHWTG